MKCLSNNSFKKLAQNIEYLAELIKSSADPYLYWLENEESVGNGNDLDENFKNSVYQALSTISQKYGMKVTKNYDAQSAYFDIWYSTEDHEESVCEVRVSNHKQAYSGPIWSFEPQDSLKEILWGLNTIEKELSDFSPSDF